MYISRLETFEGIVKFPANRVTSTGASQLLSSREGARAAFSRSSPHFGAKMMSNRIAQASWMRKMALRSPAIREC